jgi:hypothetical protein
VQLLQVPMQEAPIQIPIIAIPEILPDTIQVPTLATTIVLLTEVLLLQRYRYLAVQEVVLAEVHLEADSLVVAAEAVVVNNN